GRVGEVGWCGRRTMVRPERRSKPEIEGLGRDSPPLKAAKIAAPHPLRRRAILLAALAGVIAAAVAIPIFALGQGAGEASLTAAAGDSVGVVEPDSGRLAGGVDVGAGPAPIALRAGGGWGGETPRERGPGNDA